MFIIICSNFNVLYNTTLSDIMAQELLISLFNICPISMKGKLVILWVSSNKQCHPSEPRKHTIYVTVPVLWNDVPHEMYVTPILDSLKDLAVLPALVRIVKSTLHMFAWGSVVDWICSLLLYLLFIILFRLYILPYLVLLWIDQRQAVPKLNELN